MYLIIAFITFGFSSVSTIERDCSTNACLNGGTCRVDDVTRSFRCYCSPGYTGTLCHETCSLECANGQCVKGPIGKEICKCTEGWSGDLCDRSGTTLEGCVKDSDCALRERCLENDRRLKICVGDPCETKPCRNNALCVANIDDFQCKCPPGYAGKRCEADINECELSPCKNGGTCINLEGSFECLCNERFKGSYCEVGFSFCSPNPCTNNGTCVETKTDFHCLCSKGFTGRTCQIDQSSYCKCENPHHVCGLVLGKKTCVCPDGFRGPTCDSLLANPCQPSPCNNGGDCIVTDDHFDCICKPDWSGATCSEKISCLVEGKPCENFGSCVRGLAINHCECVEGFSGQLCEIRDVRLEQCQDRPCNNGGTCREFNGTVVCECPLRFSGRYCEKYSKVSVCDPNPCQNEGICKQSEGITEDSFTCICRIGFEGNICETVISEWDSSVHEINMITSTDSVWINTTTITTMVPPTNTQSHEEISCNACHNSDVCIETSKGAICICEKGYMGIRCERQGDVCSALSCPEHQLCRPVITATDVQTKCGCPIGFTGKECKTGTAASFSENSIFIYQSPHVMIGSSSGPLPYVLSLSFRTTVPTVHIASGENIFGERLFSLRLIESRLAVNISGTLYNKLVPTNLNDGNWKILHVNKSEKDFEISLLDGFGYQLLSQTLPRLSSFDVFSTRIGKISESDLFIGCMADVDIDGSTVEIASSNRGIGIVNGCEYIPQCSISPCHNGGSCIDFWTHSSCLCRPPFLPPLCMHSLSPSTFGYGNKSSLAEISVPSEISQVPRFSTDIHLIIRSNRPSGTILYLGEAHENGTTDEIGTFTAIENKDGKVVVRSRAGRKAIHELISQKRIDDNEDHVVRVERRQRHVRLYIDDVIESEGDIPSRFNHPMFIEKIQLGSSDAINKDAFTTSDYFKGSLQDIQVNGASIILHQHPKFEVDQLGRVSKLQNVLEGSISDDVCSAFNRCLRGVCHNTFNDYECKCEHGFFGRTCDQKDHCIINPCPQGGRCQNIKGGFICTSPATLKSKSSLTYELSRSTASNMTFIELLIRTHSDSGHILTVASSDSSSFSVYLSNGQLVLGGLSPFTIRKTIANGMWQKVRIEGHVIKINSGSYGFPASITLPALIPSTLLHIGSTSFNDSFDGCIQDVKVGELPILSFYRDDELKIPENYSYWKIKKKIKISTLCLSSPQCGLLSPCLNKAKCVDLWNKYRCECLPGFAGDHCEINIDECRSTDCGQGYCINKVNEARCLCDVGFTGEACDAAIDQCDHLPCKNGGLCENSNGTFNCECKKGWMGKTCEIKALSNCDDSPCKNGGKCEINETKLSCSCLPGFLGPFCEEVFNPCNLRPCKNGLCQLNKTGFSCQCEDGFTGPSCSQMVNYCSAESCNARGVCTSVWNGTLCTCDLGWQGQDCSKDVDECLSIPCENDALCINTLKGFECECRKYYMGDRCEIEGSCLSQPCIHGECIQLTHNEHKCSCQKGYEGNTCQNRIDYCKVNPCKNGATCQSLIGEHYCHCIVGFTGSNCETDIDECAEGYCSNGSKCRDRIADYDCDCEGTGFTGKNCTEDTDECLVAENCIHGECTNTHGGYICSCGSGFIGLRCSMVDPCTPDSFNRTLHSCVHGECVNPVVKVVNGHETALHECKCNRGYSGPQCNTQVEERRKLAISYVLGPMISVLVVLCLLGCALFSFVLKGKRAMHGHYSPSHQEINGARMQMNSIIKLPPEERLI